VSDAAADLVDWQTFAARVSLTFAFRIDITVRIDVQSGHRDRVQVGVELHVPERDTREPITVHTRRHVGAFTTDEDGTELIFDLLEIALRHEMNESVRLDGRLVRDTHKAAS
jgi:hypothetical protein